MRGMTNCYEDCEYYEPEGEQCEQCADEEMEDAKAKMAEERFDLHREGGLSWQEW